jgi:hypothetical protein
MALREVFRFLPIYFRERHLRVEVHGIAAWLVAGGAGAVGAALALVLEYYDSLNRHGVPPSKKKRTAADGSTFVMGTSYYAQAVACRMVIGVIVSVAVGLAWLGGTAPLGAGQIALAFAAGLTGPLAIAHLKGPASAAVLAMLDNLTGQLAKSQPKGITESDDDPAANTGGGNGG